jgi:glycerol-3-phosphate dehydrogenase
MLPRSLLSRKALAYTSAGTLAVTGGSYYFLNSGPAYPVSTRESRRPPPSWLPPGREHNLQVLRASGSGDDDAKLDLLIVGGGATGAGIAVDAASRGLKVALVERDDFSSGMTAPVVDSYFKSLLTVVVSPQGHRRNRQSSSMAAFVTCKRR